MSAMIRKTWSVICQAHRRDTEYEFENLVNPPGDEIMADI